MITNPLNVEVKTKQMNKGFFLQKAEHHNQYVHVRFKIKKPLILEIDLPLAKSKTNIAQPKPIVNS